MQHIKVLELENIPLWYELSWNEKELSLILRIHKDFIKNKPVNFTEAPIIKHYQKEYDVSTFYGDFNQDIGFDRIFKLINSEGDLNEYAIKLPQIKKLTDKKCPECKGTGDSELFDQCLYCMGRGAVTEYNWKEAIRISLNFTVLTTWLHYCEVDTVSEHPQLMTLDTITGNGLHGGSLGGEVSPALSKILLEKEDIINMGAVSKATMQAYGHMLGLNEFDKYSFHTQLTGARFIIDCPGNACGINPGDWTNSKDNGYGFSCHNVDNAGQQLTLLVGLAKLCDLVRAL